MRRIYELLGLTCLGSFTSIDVLLAIIAKGAYISYYETNKAIWLFEICAGIFGVTIAILRIKERLDEK